MLILLDINGVMVPAKGWKSPELHNDGFPVFSNKATLVLQSLICIDTTIILTSSHKANFSIEEWKNIFKKRSINIENLKCIPSNVNNLRRKDEIINWFNVNNINECFVIIDEDKLLNELPDFLKENLVQTSQYIGLTEEHLKKIRTIMFKQS